MQTIDTEQIKHGIDLSEMAGRYTELSRESALEMAGPCPKCGGNDRFHCTADWFFCRQCHPKRGDVIAFVQWAAGLSFLDACKILAGGSLPTLDQMPTRPARRAARQSEGIEPGQAREIVERAAVALLDSPEGEAGRAYLSGRGIGPTAWEAYRLGFRADVPLPGTRGKKRAVAIAIPWILSDGRIPAIRYRFLTVQSYTDDQGRERTEKQTAQSGSSFAGRLFGGPMLVGPSDGRTLLLCEGEINAMSVWTATLGSIDTLSLGSESAHLPERAIQAIQGYSRVIVWADQARQAGRLMDTLPGAMGLSSPRGMDANDLHRAGMLRAFLDKAIERNVQ